MKGLPAWLVREGAPLEHLSNFEVLAGIIGDCDAAARLLEKTRGSIRDIKEMGADRIVDVSGVDYLSARRLILSFDLSRRLSEMLPFVPVKITCPADASRLFMDELRYAKKEHFCVLLLDTKNSVISKNTVSVGTLNMSVVHPREIFKLAICQSAASVIILHNHPSGDPTPSDDDINLTKIVIDVGEVMKIPVRDHLIIGDGVYYSFKERALFF